MLRDESRSTSDTTFDETTDEAQSGDEAGGDPPLQAVGERGAISAGESARGIAAGLLRLHGELRERVAPVVSRDVWSGLLDSAYRTLGSRVDRITLERVFVALKELKVIGHPQWWEQFAQRDSLAHPIREVFHADPFTRRSFEKPRGYAGD